MSEQDELLINGFLAETLSPEEQILFDQRKADPAFAEYLNNRKKMDHFLDYKNGAGIKMEDVLALNQKYFSEQKNSPTEEKIPTINWWKTNRKTLTIAASLLFLLLFYFLLRPYLSTPPNAETLYATYAQHQAIEAARSIEETCTSFSILQESFNAGQYADALAALNNCLAENPQNLELQLYKGIALLETQQASEALEIFQGLANGNSLLKNEGLWYNALTQLKVKNIEASKTNLAAISAQSARYKKAQELLQQLN